MILIFMIKRLKILFSILGMQIDVLASFVAFVINKYFSKFYKKEDIFRFERLLL